MRFAVGRRRNNQYYQCVFQRSPNGDDRNGSYVLVRFEPKAPTEPRETTKSKPASRSRTFGSAPAFGRGGTPTQHPVSVELGGLKAAGIKKRQQSVAANVFSSNKSKSDAPSGNKNVHSDGKNSDINSNSKQSESRGDQSIAAADSVRLAGAPKRVYSGRPEPSTSTPSNQALKSKHEPQSSNKPLSTQRIEEKKPQKRKASVAEHLRLISEKVEAAKLAAATAALSGAVSGQDNRGDSTSSEFVSRKPVRLMLLSKFSASRRYTRGRLVFYCYLFARPGQADLFSLPQEVQNS